MSNYRRRYVPGGTFFFTVVTHLRRRLFSSNEARACLRRATLSVQQEYPFEMVATVLLPEHWHCLWALPEDDVDYSKRLGLIKSRFTRLWLAGGGRRTPVSSARRQHRERGVWQKRFWEHAIRDEVDLMRHVHYIHYNPVKHGLVRCPHAWRHSSFRRWVGQGYYGEDWLCECANLPVEVPQILRQAEAFGE
jgi:putative transposase